MWIAEYNLNTFRLQSHHVLTGSLLHYLKSIKQAFGSKIPLRIVKLPLESLYLEQTEEIKGDVMIGLRVMGSSPRDDLEFQKRVRKFHALMKSNALTTPQKKKNNLTLLSTSETVEAPAVPNEIPSNNHDSS